MTQPANVPGRPASRTVPRWVQAGLALLVLAFLVPALARRWDEFRTIEIDVHPAPGWLALSVVVVLATYLLQIESWRRVLAGWHQHLPYGLAARAWCVANLARYVPGKVWSIAGLVVLVQRAGVETWAATASAVVAQAVALATGIAAVAFAAPTIAYGAILGMGFVVAAAVLVAMGSAKLMRLANRFAPGDGLRALPATAVLASGTLMLASWVGYGVAFWALGRGLGITGLDLTTAIGMFTGAYIAGWLMLFAPAGVIFREAALVTLLAPIIGAGGAATLSVASRLVLTLTEVGAAGLAVGLARTRTDVPLH
jgi:glycosyltransferase 2 family protein